MKTRDATESDVVAMYAVDRAAAEEGSRRHQIREWVDARQAIVALVDEVVVGYAVLEYTFFSNGFISMLIVDGASRRQGIATALVRHLEKACVTNKLFTSTNESNEPMQGLMHSMSYEPSGTVYNLDEGDPELFYVKRLPKKRYPAATADSVDGTAKLNVKDVS
ncbi:MAG: GNAT family N-acetyltransferase [Cyanobacteria bacterium J06634_6]